MNEQAQVVTMPWKALAPADNLLAVITDAVRTKSVDMDTLKQLIDMHNELKRSAEEEAFDSAMNEAQAEMTRVAADSHNPQTRSKYVSYGALDRAVRPIYTRHGFSLSFDTGESEENTVLVKCRVSRGGAHRDYSILMPADGKGAKGGDVMSKTHALASGVTYARRYLLAMIFNMATGQDDDGNAAGAKTAVEVLSEEQVKAVKAAIELKGLATEKILTWQNVDRLEDIPAVNYDFVLAGIAKQPAAK